MYFAHKLAQLPVAAIAANGWTDRQTRTDMHRKHTHTHKHMRVVHADRADML